VLCNWTVTFYSLPELSPVFGTTQIRSCNWIGGIDLNSNQDGGGQDGRSPSVTVLLSLNKKMKVIRIGDEPRALRVMGYGTLAGKSYKNWLTYTRQSIMRDALSPYAVIHLLVLPIHDLMRSSMLIVSSKYHCFPFPRWTTHSPAVLAAVSRIFQAMSELVSHEVHLRLKVAILLLPMTGVTIGAPV
jgi:hypothetical protein